MAYELYLLAGPAGARRVRPPGARGRRRRLCRRRPGHGHGPGRRRDDELCDSKTLPQTPFAPPFLRDGDILVSHVANILMYLGPRLGLAPAEEALRHFANGLQLTITDLVAEVHDTHHPIASALYYEDQKEAAKARSAAFLSRAACRNISAISSASWSGIPHGAAHSVGDATSYVDLSLFQLVEGLRYAFPRASANFGDGYPLLTALARRVTRAAAHRRLSQIGPTARFQRIRDFPEISGAGSGREMTRPAAASTEAAASYPAAIPSPPGSPPTAPLR